ncbi:short-chain dehydrogenase/reductase family 16C member 6-like isoform X2 [Cimex lectularius]|nr:short-chain dehydrogenase/reductase family 16C member 6-like isoform X2 [Cimex lectularius]XP_014239416.1 short-chain dehydrogenase/reductase family 16C member 6-like isoform X2 [Cimex lectularius]
MTVVRVTQSSGNWDAKPAKKRDLFNSINNFLTLTCEILVLMVNLFLSLVESLMKLVLPSQEKLINNDIILVTGTGHGIGRELVLRLSTQGCKIVCWDVNEEGNAETYKIAKEKNLHKNLYMYKCDVSCREDVLALAEKVRNDVGDVTILVNNAGIMTCKPLEKQGHDTVKRIFDVNTMAHFWMLEAFLPGMKQKNKGHIVAVCSMCGIMGMSYGVPYCASKFAVRGLMESLYEELRNDRLANKIKLTTVFPIGTDTGLAKNLKNRFPNLVPVLTPEEVALAIVMAIKKETFQVSVPSSVMGFNNVMRLFPRKFQDLILDFMDTGVYPD